MAGKFEVFMDADSRFRFRLIAPDGTVMALSGVFDDKPAVAAGIAAVRECAGTGLVTDLSARTLEPRAPVPVAVSEPTQPTCDEQPLPHSRVRAFAHANAARGRVTEPWWSSAV